MFLSFEGWAQQDPQFSQYMFNSFYYNPAFAGSEGVTKITGLFRSQWLGYSPTYGDGGAPTTQIFSIHTPVPKLKGGVGGYVVNDKLGPLNNFEAQLSYAYAINVKDAKLSFGLRAGALSGLSSHRSICRRGGRISAPILIGTTGNWPEASIR